VKEIKGTVDFPGAEKGQCSLKVLGQRRNIWPELRGSPMFEPLEVLFYFGDLVDLVCQIVSYLSNGSTKA
jgi:hypothetical protein